jgi:hypothetical protein
MWTNKLLLQIVSPIFPNAMNRVRLAPTPSCLSDHALGTSLWFVMSDNWLKLLDYLKVVSLPPPKSCHFHGFDYIQYSDLRGFT